MKKSTLYTICILALALVLALTASQVSAGDTGPIEPKELSPAATTEDVQNYFPVQGRLTDASDNPLTGDYSITFRLYDAYTGGTALCSDTNTVKVQKGLFSTEVWGDCADHIQGAQLFMSIEVESSGELDPRQPIFAVPYAWSLRPGAVVIGSVGPEAMLHLENSDPSGRGLRSYATSLTGENYGVVGAAKSPAGFGGYFYNNGGGTGLKVESNTGAALEAAGSGIIRSSATSTIWISGSSLRPYSQSYTGMTINMDSIGGAVITGGIDGTRNVVLPVTIPGPLYGQNVTVTGMDVFYRTSTDTNFISVVLLRRQNGVCDTCYVGILRDDVDHKCADASAPASGCSLHWNLPAAISVISADSGILYLTFELDFDSPTGWVEIGGVRLTLAHD